MVPCYVIGDSIAVGTAKFTDCTVEARVGLSAAGFAAYVEKLPSGYTIISLCSNPGPHDESTLSSLRSALTGPVVWLLPPARLRSFIVDLANRHGDRIVDVRDGGAGPGHIHPNAAGYRKLAGEVEGALR